MELTPEQFTRAARAMAREFLDTVAQAGRCPDDTANLAGAALAEVIGQQLGKFGAANRLRDLADILENEAFEEPRLN